MAQLMFAQAADQAFEFESEEETELEFLRPERALVVDVQSVARMDGADAKAYLAVLGERLALLRAERVPVIWTVIGEANRMHAPRVLDEDEKPQARPVDSLIGMGFYGAKPEYKGHKLFRQFLKDYGPRDNEAVYTKYFKNALAEPEDAAGKPGYKAILEAESGKAFSQIPAEAFESRPTLTEYLQADEAQTVLVMGAVSSHCVAETAVGAAAKGFDAAVYADLVLSWTDEDESKVDPNSSTLAWRKSGLDEAASVQWHSRKIQNTIDKIKADPARGHSAEAIEAIGKIELIGTVDENDLEFSFEDDPKTTP
jgi:nicotinamidase-related amidase